MFERLNGLKNQYEELLRRMEEPETYSDPRLYARCEREARELAVPTGSPLLHVTRVAATAEGTPFELSDDLFRAEVSDGFVKVFAAVAPGRALDCSVDTAYATRLCFPSDLGVLKGFPDWAPRREIRVLDGIH